MDSLLLFAGQYEDGESGWVYNRYRFYDPTIGVYGSQDPLGVGPNIGTPQGYVTNPVTWVDILGLESYKSIKSTAEQPYRGGPYQALDTKAHDGGQFERHHLVSQKSLKDNREVLRGPDGVIPDSRTPRHATSIQMTPDDHMETGSWGTRGAEYRQKESIMLQEGRYNEAFSMGIRDVQDKFGSKYDDALYEAWLRERTQY